MPSPIVFVRHLGRVKYSHALREQLARMDVMVDSVRGHNSLRKFYCNELQQSSIYNILSRDTIITCEHDPVYTNGRRAKYEDVTKHEDNFKKLGAEYFQVDRGGLITFHGPGQLVCYPILNLQHFRPSIRWYIQALEEAVMLTCQAFGVFTQRTPDTGLWVGNSKICAMGVQASRFITCHGLALNCNTDLSWFNHIVPCGLHGKSVTSLSKETGRNVTVEDAMPHLLSSLEQVLDCQLLQAPGILLPPATPERGSTAL